MVPLQNGARRTCLVRRQGSPGSEMAKSLQKVKAASLLE